MRLNDNEFGIGTLCCKGEEMKDAINITKEALESWRDHYRKVCQENYYINISTSLYYLGMADVLTELLNHFEEED